MERVWQLTREDGRHRGRTSRHSLTASSGATQCSWPNVDGMGDCTSHVPWIAMREAKTPSTGADIPHQDRTGIDLGRTSEYAGERGPRHFVGQT